jgi:putative glutamine amidotransferase
MSKPLIGVTVSEIRNKEDAQRVPHGEPTQTEMTLGLSYMRAVERAGGLPVALPPLATGNVDQLLDHLSGLLLTGGPDLDPSCYGAKPHAELGPTDSAVDVFEIALCRRADRRGLPILGICRGAQVLNVARQGTLHQHLPDLLNSTAGQTGAVEHRQLEPGDRTTHEIRVAPDSGLAQTTGGGPMNVNSFHHQAIDRLGLDLRSVAWAKDGMIEAVEDDRRGFVLGVQWHAETLVGEADQLALFERLVETAKLASQNDSGEQRGSGAHAV